MGSHSRKWVPSQSVLDNMRRGSFEYMTLQRTLNNGLMVCVFPNSRNEDIGIGVGIRYGYIDENENTKGIGNVIVSTLQDGTKSRTQEIIMKNSSQIGLKSQMLTDFEYTRCIFQFPREKIESAMDIISDCIINPTFPTEKLEIEKRRILEDKKSVDHNLDMFTKNILVKLLYSGNHGILTLEDNRTTIKGLDGEDINSVYIKEYTPVNMFLGLYGDIRHEEGFELSEKFFGNFNRIYKPKQREILIPNKNRKTIIEENWLSGKRMIFAFKNRAIKNLDIQEYLSMKMLAYYLDYQIEKELIRKEGAAHLTNVDYIPYANFAMTAILIDLNPKETNKEITERIIKEQIRKIQAGDVDIEEFNKLKESFVNNYFAIFLDSAASVKKMIRYALDFKRPELFEMMPDMLRGVRFEEVVKYANEYLNGDNCSIIILQPKEHKDFFKWMRR